jgi:hypothetical protein
MSLRLQDALAYHGLTREITSSELIQYLGSIRLESPFLYDMMVRDPPDIAGRIAGWDFLFSTGMTTEYPLRRNWNAWLAMRELVQNALDIEDNTFGYENIRVNVYTDAQGVHVVNRGPPMSRDAWKLGGSDKQCWERGRFGEGLKVASAYFAYQGTILYVFTGNEVYKAIVSPGTSLVVVLLGRPISPTPGITEAVVHNATIEPGTIENMVFQQFMKTNHPRIIAQKALTSTTCDHPRTSYIVDFSDHLWVGDIYVNSLYNITAHASTFSYNLWYVDLEPNRITVQSIDQLGKMIAKTYTKEAITELLNRWWEDGANHIPSHHYIGTFEVRDIPWYATSDEVLDAVAEFVKDKNFYVTTDQAAVNWFRYLTGEKVVVVEKDIESLFTRAQDAETRLEQIDIKNEKEVADTFSSSELSLLERGRYSGVMYLYNELYNKVAVFAKFPEVRIVRELLGGRSNGVKTEVQKGEAIIAFPRKLLANGKDYFETRELLSAAVHEFGHYYGDFRFGDAPDLSHAFEDALTYVAGALGFLEPADIAMIQRCMQGARSFTWPVTDDEKKRLLRKGNEIGLVYSAQTTFDSVDRLSIFESGILSDRNKSYIAYDSNPDLYYLVERFGPESGNRVDVLRPPPNMALSGVFNILSTMYDPNDWISYANMTLVPMVLHDMERLLFTPENNWTNPISDKLLGVLIYLPYSDAYIEILPDTLYQERKLP